MSLLAMNSTSSVTDVHEKIYTIAQVSDLLRVEETSVIRFIGENSLTGYKQAGQWYVLHSDVIRFIKSGEKNGLEN